MVEQGVMFTRNKGDVRINIWNICTTGVYKFKGRWIQTIDGRCEYHAPASITVEEFKEFFGYTLPQEEKVPGSIGVLPKEHSSREDYCD